MNAKLRRTKAFGYIRRLAKTFTEKKAEYGYSGAETIKALESLLKAADQAKLRSPWLLWSTVQSLKARGRLTEAFDLACKGVILDPLHPMCSDMFVEVSTALRNRLTGGTLAPDDPERAELHAALSSQGETDAACDLALCEHWLATGKTARAIELVTAVLVLQPRLREGWELKLKLASIAGDPGCVEQCQTAIEGEEHVPHPFSLPSPTHRS